MKKITLAFALLASTLMIFSCANVSASNKTFNDLYQKYKAEPGSVSIELPGILMEAILNSDKDGQKARKKQDVQFFQILVLDREDAGQKTLNQAQDEARSLLHKSAYKDLMTIKEKDGGFEFKYREERGKVRELVMVGYGDDSLVMLNLSGMLDKASLKEFCRSIEIDGVRDMTE